MKRGILCLFFLIGFFMPAVFAQQLSIQFGPEETVFDWTTQRCDRYDVPDAPVRAFRDVSGNIQLIASHYTNRRFIGSNLNNVAKSCQVILSSSLNPDPSQYNDHEWITSTYTLDGQTIYAIVHNEHHGYLYNLGCTSYFQCWYNSLTQAISTNAGATYTQVSSPNHLITSLPYQYVINVGPYGYYNPSNIIYKDGYYYSFFHAFGYLLQSRGACLMRTQDLADSSSWRMWSGSGFNVVPINPYTTTVSNPANYLCQPVDVQDLGPLATSITYNSYLGKYIMLGTHVTGNLPSQQGFFYSLSSNLIDWEPFQLFMSTVLLGTPSAQGSGGGQWEAYPVLLEETSSRNFEITGQQPYLYYTKKNPNSAELEFDRDLVRRRVTFNLVDVTPPSIVPNLNTQSVGSSIMQVFWGAATDNIGVTGYLVDVSTSSSFNSFVTGWQANNVGNVLSAVVSNLNPGTTYYVRMRARDAAGNLGPYSQIVSITTPTQSVPFDFNLIASYSSSVSQGNSLYATISANLLSGTSQPVGFSVSNLPTGITASVTPQSCTVSCSSTISLFISNNVPVQTYNILVSAVGGGITKSSVISFLVTSNTDTIAPSIVPYSSLQVIDSNNLQITWGAATDNVGVTGYLVDVSTSSSFNSFVTGWFNRNVGTQLDTQIGGLIPNTVYYARVRARDAAGNLGPYLSANPATTLQQTQQMQIPTLPLVIDTIYNSESNYIIIKWIDSLYEQEYLVEKSNNGRNFEVVANLPADITFYRDDFVSQNAVYSYRIKATNTAGSSEYSYGGLKTIPYLIENTQENISGVEEITQNSNSIIIREPFRESGGYFEYNWMQNYEVIVILIDEIIPFESVILRPNINNPSRKAIISNYSTTEDFSEDIKEDFELIYFFAMDAEEYEGMVDFNFKIPVQDSDDLNDLYLITKGFDGYSDVQMLERTKSDETYVYYTASTNLFSGARYSLASEITHSLRNYLILGALILVLTGLIILVVILLKRSLAEIMG